MTTAALTRVAHGDFTKDLDLSQAEFLALLDLADDVKRSPASYRAHLAGKSIALLFEKPSLRTRMTFELAIQQLGGFAILNDGPIGAREPLKDVARNLDRWVDGIVARTFQQKTVDDLARHARVPIVNALSDMWHPCQALADMQTLREHFGDVRGAKLAFVGDGNNVAHSLMLCAARLGMEFAIANPPKYDPNTAVVDQARAIARENGAGTIPMKPREERERFTRTYGPAWAPKTRLPSAVRRFRIIRWMKTCSATRRRTRFLCIACPPNAVRK
jgi:ornithine carbamoyltransferase